jgi:hypothetical protein
MQALGRFALIGRALGRKPEDARDAEVLELGKVIAEGARLRRAAACAGDLVSALGRRLTGAPGARIDVDHGAAGELRQVDM